jgi:hypothetical protein
VGAHHSPFGLLALLLASVLWLTRRARIRARSHPTSERRRGT